MDEHLVVRARLQRLAVKVRIALFVLVRDRAHFVRAVPRVHFVLEQHVERLVVAAHG